MAPLFNNLLRRGTAMAGSLLVLLLSSGTACAQTGEEVDAAQRALDLKIYQATTEALVAQREAEVRKATAEAERAELLARLPPSTSRALAKACQPKLAGLGAGYLGELDAGQHDKLLGKVRALGTHRGDYAGRITVVQRLADAAKGEHKKELTAVANAAERLLKTVDAFVESLKVGEASDKSPLFNAARYLGYASRTSGALVLDFDLRLEGLTIMTENLFTGQHLRLSGVAFLWYRLYEANGALRVADAVRRISEPVEVDLRGKDAGGVFWDAPGARLGR